jgi:hypothetical protein
MTFTRKISQIPTAAAALTATDRLEVTQGIGTTPVTRYLEPSQITDWVETDIVITNAMVNATSANTANAIVARDANGDFAMRDASFRDASVRQVILRGDTSGTATVKVPAIAGTPTFTLPDGVGTIDQVLSTDGTGVLSWATPSGGGGGGAGEVVFSRFNFR